MDQVAHRRRQYAALAWLLLVAGAGLAAPYLPLPFAPAEPDLLAVGVSPAQGAGAGHWLGTDPLGRDVLAGLLFGARTLVLVTVPAALLAALLGAVLGSLAGYGRRLAAPAPAWLLGAGLGWWGLALPRPALGLAAAAGAGAWALGQWLRHRSGPVWALSLDALIQGAGALVGTVPRLVLVAAVATGGPLSLTGLGLLLVLTNWPGPARLVRAETLRVRALPFVEAARALGLPAACILRRHVLPLALRPLRADLPLRLAAFVGLESTLSFLGLGLPPDTASWGRLLDAARLDPAAWWTAAPPMLALLLTTGALLILSKK